jgi:hypothetical protein
MIRNSHPEIFKWLPIGRIGPRAGSAVSTKPGVMEAIKGNI